MKVFQRRWTAFQTLVLVAAAGWIGLTAAFTGPTTEGQAPAPRPGFLAPDFTLLTPEGEIVQLSDLRGQPVILNLWASWCPPCKAEMPALENVHREYAPQGLVVLGVNMTYQDNLAAAVQFYNQQGLTFPFVLDEDGSVGRRYQMRALPTTFFIDRQGMVQSVEVGGPLPEAMLRAKALELLEAR